jgi:glutamyl-tRNA synthetase
MTIKHEYQSILPGKPAILPEMEVKKASERYRGRIAPTPTGLLHAGHAATFWTAYARARAAEGRLILRIEDIDPQRCRRDYVDACISDLSWLGISWDEGPIYQSLRSPQFLEAWKRLRDTGFIYPSPHSRRDVEQAAQAPHDEEPIFPIDLRQPVESALMWDAPVGTNWRFRVPDGEAISFVDGRHGEVTLTAGRDFGDFVVWRRDDVPAYELAVVVDDIAMQITEVVRGEDLLVSTARQILLYRALGAEPPDFYHCPLVRDADGQRMAKRSASMSLSALREAGKTPAEVLASAAA